MKLAARAMPYQGFLYAVKGWWSLLFFTVILLFCMLIFQFGIICARALLEFENINNTIQKSKFHCEQKHLWLFKEGREEDFCAFYYLL